MLNFLKRAILSFVCFYSAVGAHEFSGSASLSVGYEYDKQAWRVGFTTLEFDFEAPTNYIVFPVDLKLSLNRWSLRGYGRGGVMIDSSATDEFTSFTIGELSKVRGPLNGYKWVGGGELVFEAFSFCQNLYSLSFALGGCYEYTKYPVPSRYQIESGAVIPSFTFAPGGSYIPIFFGPLIGLDGGCRWIPNLDATVSYRAGLWDFHSDSTLNGGIITSPDLITPNNEKYIYKARIRSILVQQFSLKLFYHLTDHLGLIGWVEGQTMQPPLGKATVSINGSGPLTNAICQATSRSIFGSFGVIFFF